MIFLELDGQLAAADVDVGAARRPTPVQSAAHIAIWLGNLKAVTSKGDQIAPEAGEILAKLYAVMQQRPGSSKISRKATSETDLMAPLITKRARGIT